MGFIISLGICPKVNVIARVEFKLSHYYPTVQRFNYYTTRKHLSVGRCFELLLRMDSVPFSLICLSLLLWVFVSLSLEISTNLIFFLVIFSGFFLVAVSSLYFYFFYNLRVSVLMHPHYFQCCRVLLLLNFLTRIVYLCHFLYIRTYASWLFFFVFWSNFLSSSLVHFKEFRPGVYTFDEILAAEFCFKMLSSSSEIVFFFYRHLFESVRF